MENVSQNLDREITNHGMEKLVIKHEKMEEYGKREFGCFFTRLGKVERVTKNSATRIVTIQFQSEEAARTAVQHLDKQAIKSNSPKVRVRMSRDVFDRKD